LPFYNSGSIKYYKFLTLEIKGLYHAVFTRRGGFSPAPWRSLNIGASVGDDVKRVVQNREAALSSLHLNSERVYDLYQVHSTKIIITDQPLSPNVPHQKADAIITLQPDVILLMRFADCVPILLYDPVNRVIGIAHAGWIGTVDRIALKTVLCMTENFHTNPGDIVAALGPSIGPDHYSVGREVLERIRASFGDNTDQIVIYNQDKAYFDLWKANQLILNQVGVNKVEVSGICTCCNLGDWYSHRGEHGKTGRFGVILGMSI